MWQLFNEAAHSLKHAPRIVREMSYCASVLITSYSTESMYFQKADLLSQYVCEQSISPFSCVRIKCSIQGFF